ncbi:MAG TPA: hypothetical protein EYG18_02700 [Micavibrio sp.]|nr:hypothetical protein [Pseudomonadota bacterium]MEC8665333.1 hypothetical protein [Pseudomonadota bacterium]HIF25731.1 hypothetical protein [Micavibrio sp.]HIL28156.1 hypothetical protein [Micavibrio sp.]|tara:strand:- start:205 stop:405 length:201 start_codon:yes stop_codon:yes gene_type:complete
MKKFVTTMLVGSALTLGACASNGEADYNYETQAPYADERTVGSEEAPVVVTEPRRAERVFESSQRK